MIHSFFLYAWLVASALLIVTVLLHSPKGDGMGGIATGAGGTMFTSARSAENTLNRVTWILVAVFLVVAVALSAGWLREVEPLDDSPDAQNPAGAATTEAVTDVQPDAALPAEPEGTQPLDSSEPVAPPPIP